MVPLDGLSEEVLAHVCSFLNARDLIQFATTCTALHDLVLRDAGLWHSLAERLLGKTFVMVHRAELHRRQGSEGPGCTATFYRKLTAAATRLDHLEYASCVGYGSLALDGPAADKRRLVAATGHNLVVLDHLVVTIGGMRPVVKDPRMEAFFVDTQNLRLVDPRIEGPRTFPRPRMRASACAIARPPWLPRPPDAPDMPCALVLGGVVPPRPPVRRDLAAVEAEVDALDDAADLAPGTPMHNGVHGLLVLSVLAEDGSRARWDEAVATGTAPRGIWHHESEAFAGGSSVVLFGGDVSEEDPEFEALEDRHVVGHVYVLAVAARVWSRVATSGDAPSWRSLHVAVVVPPSVTLGGSCPSAGERLVVVGGTEEHTAPFSMGGPADPRAYSLDLETMRWRRGPHQDGLPAARLRFAAVSRPSVAAGTARGLGRGLKARGGGWGLGLGHAYSMRRRERSPPWTACSRAPGPPPRSSAWGTTSSPWAAMVSPRVTGITRAGQSRATTLRKPSISTRSAGAPWRCKAAGVFGRRERRWCTGKAPRKRSRREWLRALSWAALRDQAQFAFSPRWMPSSYGCPVAAGQPLPRPDC